MIKKFVEANDVASAQNIILEELEGQFGGVAEAMAKNPVGLLQQQKNTLGDIQEEIGEKIIPAQIEWNKLLLLLAGNIESIAIGSFVTGVTLLAPKIITATKAMYGLNLAMKVNPAIAVAASVTALTIAIREFWKANSITKENEENVASQMRIREEIKAQQSEYERLAEFVRHYRSDEKKNAEEINAVMKNYGGTIKGVENRMENLNGLIARSWNDLKEVAGLSVKAPAPDETTTTTTTTSPSNATPSSGITEEEERINSLLKERESILNSLQSPLDKIESAQARYTELREMGVLTELEYDRALKSTQEQIEALIETEKNSLAVIEEAQKREIEILYNGLYTQEELIRQSYDSRRQMILDTTAITETEKNDLILRLDKQTKDKQKEMEIQSSQARLSQGEQFFGQMMGITKEFGGEQSKFYKAMFNLQQGFALASALVSIGKGLASSSEVGWPQNLITMAGHIASTAGIIGSIASVNFSGEYANGGTIPAGKWGIVGETGKPEIVHGPATVTGVNDTANILKGKGETHVHFHIGTLVSDGRSEKEFVRRVMPSFQRELQRVGRA